MNLVFWFLLSMYFLPTIIAAARQCHNQWAILALNLLLGWTFFGWVVAFVWSVSTGPVPMTTYHVVGGAYQPAPAAPRKPLAYLMWALGILLIVAFISYEPRTTFPPPYGTYAVGHDGEIHKWCGKVTCD